MDSRRLDMKFEMIDDFIKGTEDRIEIMYEELKKNCVNFGDLRADINKVSKEISWNDKNMGVAVSERLLRKFNEDVNGQPFNTAAQTN